MIFLKSFNITLFSGKIIKLSLVPLFCLFSGFLFGQDKEFYQKIGDSLMENGQYETAIEYFSKEVTKYPNNESLLRHLGYAHIYNNDLELGEKYYRKAVLLNPKCTSCFLNLGTIAGRKGDLNKAVKLINRAIGLDSSNAMAYSIRGQIRGVQGNRIGALGDLNRAIKIDPLEFQFYINRGSFNSTTGYPFSAKQDFTKAIELAPNNYLGYYRRGQILFYEQKFEKALIDINAGIALDSGQSSLYLVRGGIMDELGNNEKALQDYNKAVDLDPSAPLTYLERASSFYKSEDLDASCRDYYILDSLISIGELTDSGLVKSIKDNLLDFCDSSRPSYYYQRGVGYYNLKEYHKALEIYGIGLKVFPKNALMLSFKGNAYMMVDEYQKALKIYQLSLENKEGILNEVKVNPRFSNASDIAIENYLQGSFSSIYFSMAECNTFLGNFEEAMADINKALDIVPITQEIHLERYYNLRGYIYLMSENYNKAISEFEKCIKINPGFSYPYVNMAIAKINKTEKIKISAFSFDIHTQNQTFNIGWKPPKRRAIKKLESKLKLALEDCNTAIQFNPENAYAYYIRAQIKRLLKHNDYCHDFLRADLLSLPVEKSILEDCQ